MTIQMISWQLIVLSPLVPIYCLSEFCHRNYNYSVDKIGLCMKSKGKIKTSGIECQGLILSEFSRNEAHCPAGYWVVAL